MSRRALVALSALVAVAAAPSAARTRIELVAGWRIAHGGTGDGGHFVRLSRRGPGYRYDHYLEFWRGNGGVVIEDVFRRGACRSGDASAIVATEQALARETFDQRLADYLRECPLPRAETLRLRRSLDRAYRRFSILARRARAAMDAENDAIARHGAQR